MARRHGDGEDGDQLEMIEQRPVTWLELAELYEEHERKHMIHEQAKGALKVAKLEYDASQTELVIAGRRVRQQVRRGGAHHVEVSLSRVASGPLDPDWRDRAGELDG